MELAQVQEALCDARWERYCPDHGLDGPCGQLTRSVLETEIVVATRRYVHTEQPTTEAIWESFNRGLCMFADL